MSRRRGWKKGDWIFVDEESGLEKWASETVLDAYNKRLDKRWQDYLHPQEFIKAKADPYAVPFTNGENTSFDACVFFPFFVGNTTVTANAFGPSNHIFKFGIGQMQIGCSFVVHPVFP